MCAVFKRSKPRSVLAGRQGTLPSKPPVQIAQKAARVAFENTAWKRAPKPTLMIPLQIRMQKLLTRNQGNVTVTRKRKPQGKG